MAKKFYRQIQTGLRPSFKQFETLAGALDERSTLYTGEIFEGELTLIGTAEMAMVPTCVLRKPETDSKGCVAVEKELDYSDYE